VFVQFSLRTYVDFISAYLSDCNTAAEVERMKSVKYANITTCDSSCCGGHNTMTCGVYMYELLVGKYLETRLIFGVPIRTQIPISW
jgi:hypothetical protein